MMGFSDDKLATIEFWKAALEIFVQSNCDKTWTKKIKTHVKYMALIINGNDVSIF